MKNSQGSIMSNKIQNKWRLCFLTLFFSGNAPKAPGTIGSLVALILGIPLLYFSNNTLFLLSIFIALVAIKQIDIYESLGGPHDDKSIVIDELVGMWMALSIIPFDWLGIACAFGFFRLFDIWKPSWIGVLDKKVKGGLGVVGDDALAGILAGLVSSGILRLGDILFSLS